MTSSLWCSTRHGLTARESWDTATQILGPCTVLVSEPEQFHVEHTDGTSPDHVTASAFALRFFNMNGEVRWELLRDGRGDAVIVTDQPHLAASGELVQISGVLLDQSYFCWGTVSRVSDRDCTLTSTRTCDITVPLAALDTAPSLGQYLLLKSRELLMIRDDADGNACIATEALVGFTTEAQK